MERIERQRDAQLRNACIVRTSHAQHLAVACHHVAAGKTQTWQRQRCESEDLLPNQVAMEQNIGSPIQYTAVMLAVVLLSTLPWSHCLPLHAEEKGAAHA